MLTSGTNGPPDGNLLAGLVSGISRPGNLIILTVITGMNPAA